VQKFGTGAKVWTCCKSCAKILGVLQLGVSPLSQCALQDFAVFQWLLVAVTLANIHTDFPEFQWLLAAVTMENIYADYYPGVHCDILGILDCIWGTGVFNVGAGHAAVGQAP
jgi:hypothetical protein